MIYRSETALSFLVEFPSGVPDGNVVWTLRDEAGTTTDTGTITPAVGSVSTTVLVPANKNTLGTGIFIGYRDLSWTFSVAGQQVNNEIRYSLEARTPWGASGDGVRRKLGVEKHELPDEEVSLITAYYDLVMLMGDPDLSVYVPTPRERLRLGNAIEAIAAMTALPTLQVRLASKESSGTDTFQRQKVDWELLALGLRDLIHDGILVVDPAFDPTGGFGALLVLARPATDAITGQAI